MTTPELVNKIAELSGVKKGDINEVLTAFNDVILSELAMGDFTLLKLGKLKKVSRAARVCRNPQTGGKIEVAAKNTVVFKLSPVTEKAVN